MAHEFRLPDIGEGLTDAEIVAWHVGVGDDIAAEQLLVDVETAKAVVGITSPYAGTVLHLGGDAGDSVDVGSILVVIGEAGEDWQPEAKGAASPRDSEQPAPPETTSGAASSPPQQVKAVPVVRKLARDLGVDLAALTGSGPDGAITRGDVEAATAGSKGSADERVAMSRLRRTIAENMTRSWREIPHVTVQAEVDATRLLEARRDLVEGHGAPVPLEAVVARAVLPLLAEFPEFNATIDGEDLILRSSHDLGFAVDTEDGLLVVVVRGAADLDAAGLGDRIVDLATRAKKRTATTQELTGQTFTISNIGALGGGHGTPIIPLGTTAILSCGRATEQAVVRDGEIVAAPVMPIDLSYDHRVIDGGLGQRFLAALVTNLENPPPVLA